MLFRLLAATLLLAGCATAGPDIIRLSPTATDRSGAVHQEFGFASRDGLPLFGQSWSPASGSPRAVLVVVHGLKDHSGRYGELADEAVQRGYSVWAFDLRGHGRSAGDRVEINSFDDYLGDLDAFLAKVRAEEPGKPVFLFAHSMGGCVATLYTLRKRPAIAGLLLTGPAIEPPAGVSGVLIAATHVVAFLAPDAPVFDVPNDQQTRDPQSLAAENRDPLVSQGKAPAHTAVELLDAMGEIRAHWGELEVPLLAMHGTLDQLTNPQGSEDLVAHARSKDKTLKLYPGLYHDLLREPERAEVRRDLLSWLDARAPAAAAPR